MSTLVITAPTIPDAWSLAMQKCLHSGRETIKDGGSRAGMLRKGFDLAVITITHPSCRPLVPLPTPGRISPCCDDDIEKYLQDYLYTTQPPAPNEHYTYAQYLTPQVHATAEHFARVGLYNQQCIMQVGDCQDVSCLIEPGRTIPCLRLIDCRVININNTDLLFYYIYFRAWNLFGGFPVNMGGIQLLKEVHIEIINSLANTNVVCGPTIAISKDLHLNKIEWDAAKAWVGES